MNFLHFYNLEIFTGGLSRVRTNGHLHLVRICKGTVACSSLPFPSFLFGDKTRPELSKVLEMLSEPRPH